MIDETTILPDILEQKKLYINTITKQLYRFNEYERLFHCFNEAIELDYKYPHDGYLVEVKNEKVAKLLFKQGPHKLPEKK